MSSELPGILADIAEAAGNAVALRLARAVGGTEITVAKNPKPGSRITKLVGLEAARRIANTVGYGRMLIPMANLRGQGHRREVMAKVMGAGGSNTQAALAGDSHERTARRLRKRIREQEPLPLFDENQ